MNSLNKISGFCNGKPDYYGITKEMCDEFHKEDPYGFFKFLFLI